MTRLHSALFTVFALLCASCSSGNSEPSGNDGGVDAGRNPTGALAPCDEQGYPCSPSEETEAVQALVRAVRAEALDRLDAGESFAEVAAALRGGGDVVDVQFGDYALRFRVEGSAGHWIYDGSLVAEPVDLQAIIGAVEPAGATRASIVEAKELQDVSSSGAALVLREDDDETKLKKKALIVEPFAWEISTPSVMRWIGELEDTHDYESVEYQVVTDITSPQQIDDDYFRNWDDYRFVWMITHGTSIEDDIGKYSVLFSSKMCGYSAWLLKEREDGNGLEPTKNGADLESLFGAKDSVITGELTEEQDARARTFINAENAQFLDRGQLCETQQVPTLSPPLGSNENLGDVDFITYDEGWFADNFSGVLKDTFLYLRSCTAGAVPLTIAPGEAGAIVGWTEFILAEEDSLAHNVIFEKVIERAERISDGIQAANDADVTSFPRAEGGNSNLIYKEGRGKLEIRIRENISIINPTDNIPLPDEGGTLDAREITTDGKTIVEAHLLVSGFGNAPPGDFKVRIFDWDDKPLSTEIEITPPIGPKAFLTMPFELNERVTQPKEIEIEARVSLPESTSPQKYGRHRIKATVLPVAETEWRLTIETLGSLEGPTISAPSSSGIPTEDGVEWQLLLTQEPPAVIPSASLFIKDHEGRRMDCTGQTGMFEGALAIVYTDEMNAPGFEGTGEEHEDCTSDVRVTIDSFSRDADLKLRLGGTLCRVEPDPLGEGVIRTPVGFSGWATWPRAGCGMAPPNDDLVGSYISSEEPSLCIDVYQSSPLALTFNDDMGLCAQAMVTCSPQACSTDSQIGQCDYRSDSALAGFRGLVQHYRLGGPWPSATELALTCDSFGGTWTGGM